MTEKTFIDRGGTFTDVVIRDSTGRIKVKKVPSDIAKAGQLAIGHLTLGTTVATNALLERKTARTLLMVTKGFRDLLTIGDMTRPSLFCPDTRWGPPLVQEIVEVEGRIDAEGQEVNPLRLPSLDVSAFDAIAIALIYSSKNPVHEQLLRAHLLAAKPNLAISMGHLISPELGYLARIHTTCVDAAVTPILHKAMRRDHIPSTALAIRSDGSLCPATTLRAPDAVLSGPAGGVLAVQAVARQGGFQHAVGLDMGGTSTDVCRVSCDQLNYLEGSHRVAGFSLNRRSLEVETIAAGGGSILASDGLCLSVGPHSAGANPGPQCYGRGGPPTLTDAALSMGLINPEDFSPPLDASAIQLPGPAEDFLAIAREAMAAAVRKIATTRGISLHDHALVAYGGASGQHAAPVAALLGIRTVLIHPCAAVLSAWGQQFARCEEKRVVSWWRPFHLGLPAIRQTWRNMRETLPDWAEVQYSLDLRFQGTDHSLEIAGSLTDIEAHFEREFRREHARRYGFERPDGCLETVNLRCTVSKAVTPHSPQETDPWNIGDQTIFGPHCLFCSTTAIVVPDGWRAQRRNGLLVLESLSPTPARNEQLPTPAARTLWSHRFMNVAEQAGVTLARTAQSVNIRQRLDFSCALFNERGHLVANAPHIPVHLGAMGETVRDLIRHEATLTPGQSWLTNAPDAGGSHLPDLTVITPIKLGDRTVFAACRAHHVDVGGKTPGSMPPFSTHISEEGIVFRRIPLLQNGQLRALTEFLGDCRQPETVHADLAAQVAANHHAAKGLSALGEPETICFWMDQLQQLAETLAGRTIREMTPGEASDHIDGHEIFLKLQPEKDHLHVVLKASGGPHHGNLNAPAGVVRAAVLYGLRVLSGAGLPLNEGIMNRVTIHTEEPSIVAPPPSAAVAGGNVETSQRLVDLFLRAAGYMAASMGTMNNLTLGTPNWAFYETIGGGEGASIRGHGASGRQCHMTNTRATDVEILEQRVPVRVLEMSLRSGSGGYGLHNGGDGLNRHLQVLKTADASLLARYRPGGAQGLQGGEPGAPGRAFIRRHGKSEEWDGQTITLFPGEEIHIETPGGGAWGSPPK